MYAFYKINTFITTLQVTRNLFANHNNFGLDLVALNLQRGRDHGLPSYIRWREYCGLKPIFFWEDLIDDMDLRVKR